MSLTGIRPTSARSERSPRTRSWWGLGGLGFVIATLAMFSSSPTLPAPDAEADVIVAHFVENRTGILVGAYFVGLAIVAFVFLGAGLAGALRRRGHDGALPGMLLGGVVTSNTFAGFGTLAYAGTAGRVTTEGADPVAIALFTLGNKGFSFADFGNALFVTAVVVATLRYGMLPRWVGWIGAPLVPAFLVGAAGLGAETGPLIPFGTYGSVVFLSFLAWLVALSITALRGLPAEVER